MATGLRKVVMTGAAGGIGRAVTPLLAHRWDLQLSDVTPGAGMILDVTEIEDCRAAFAGADAVIHLAADPNPNALWASLLPLNVIGAHQVAQAAMDCGVRRLVLASSVQAVSGYPPTTQVRSSDAPRPANLYGATKAWAEALGSWVAATSATSVVALRIGAFTADRPGDEAPYRDRAAWLSPRDCAELFRVAVETEGIVFVVANGTSANRYCAVDLANAMEVLEYRPVDDAWNLD